MHTLLLGVGLWLAWLLLKAASPLVRHRSRAVRVASGFALLSLLPASALTLAIETFLMVDKECFGHSARWDQVTSLLGSSAVIAYFGLTLVRGLGRRARLAGLVKCLPVSQDPLLASALERHGSRSAVVRILPLGRPVAFLSGWRRPEIILSDWLLANLDEDELEAVVAHELAHARRRDIVLAALSATWARSLPLAAVLRIQESFTAEMELAADALAIRTTGRPLALACALAKFWASGSAPDPALAGAVHLAGPERLELRITRLMALSGDSGFATNPALGVAGSPLDLGKSKRPRGSSPARDLQCSALAVALAWSLVVALLGVAPFWTMTHDHQLLCRIELPS